MSNKPAVVTQVEWVSGLERVNRPAATPQAAPVANTLANTPASATTPIPAAQAPAAQATQTVVPKRGFIVKLLDKSKAGKAVLAKNDALLLNVHDKFTNSQLAESLRARIAASNPALAESGKVSEVLQKIANSKSKLIPQNVKAYAAFNKLTALQQMQLLQKTAAGIGFWAAIDIVIKNAAE
jgi:hypothetical protein